MITSVGNTRVRQVVQWMRKSKARKEQDVFLTEGVKMFLEAPAERIREVYVSETFSRSLDKHSPEQRRNSRLQAIQRRLENCGFEAVSDEVFSKMSDTQSPQGILCVMSQFHYTLEDLLSAAGESRGGGNGTSSPFLLILEDIQDPGNLGTMLRTGEAAGIDGVIMSRDTVDIYNPKTIRSTMGSVYRVPFLYADSLQMTSAELEKRRVTVYAAHLEGAVDYDVCDYTGGCAFLIGNEANGLREDTARLADRRIRIPMAGRVESLNAAAAAAVLLFEAARQRRKEA